MSEIQEFQYLQEAQDYISFNLLEKVCKAPESERPEWSHDLSNLEGVVIEFINFFRMMASGKFHHLVPTRAQDYIWHKFLECPVDYHRACMNCANMILDHDGGFGYGPGEWEQLLKQFELTKAKWKLFYGCPHPAERKKSDEADSQSICQGVCIYPGTKEVSATATSNL